MKKKENNNVRTMYWIKSKSLRFLFLVVNLIIYYV